MNVYAPAEIEEKIEFYKKLGEHCGNIQRNIKLMIVGDFNMKTGKQVYYETAAGRVTNIFIVITRYKNKKEHEVMWIRPGSNEEY